LPRVSLRSVPGTALHSGTAAAHCSAPWLKAGVNIEMIANQRDPPPAVWWARPDGFAPAGPVHAYFRFGCGLR